MTPKQKENLDAMQSLGFNTMRMSYDECIEEMIHKFVQLADACEFSEEERFRNEIKRIKQPTN